MGEREKTDGRKEYAEDHRLIAEALHKCRTTTDKNSRLEFLEQLIKLQKPWVTQVLIEALDDPCQFIGARIVKELGHSDSLEVSRLSPKLKNSPWHVKNRVLQIFGLLKNPKTVRHISIIIQEPNAEVRRTAANVLAAIGGEEAVSLLLQMVQDSNPFVRKTAETAIQKISRLRFT